MRNSQMKSHTKVLLGLVAGLGVCVLDSSALADTGHVDAITIIRRDAPMPNAFATIDYTLYNTSGRIDPFDVRSRMYNIESDGTWHDVYSGTTGPTGSTSGTGRLEYNYFFYPDKACVVDAKIVLLPETSDGTEVDKDYEYAIAPAYEDVTKTFPAQ